jgi:ribosomal protein S12 methylthiotransferase accessory factor
MDQEPSAQRLRRRPRLLAFGWPSGGSKYTFNGLHAQIDIEVEAHLLEPILRELNGHYTLQQVSERSGEPSEVVLAIVDVLERFGLVEDAPRIYRQFHEASNNPQIFRAGKWVPSSASSQSTHVGPSRDPDLASSFFRPRYTTRNLARVSLTQLQLVELLYSMYGTHEGLHAVPSAGGFYPLILDVLVFEEEDELADGWYQVKGAFDGTLTRVGDVPCASELTVSLNSRTLVEQTSILVVISADLAEICLKYGNRGYRYATIEAGHVSQNAQIWCHESGFGIFEYGGFLDERLRALLGKAWDQVPLLVLGIGGARTPMSNVDAWPNLQQVLAQGHVSQLCIQAPTDELPCYHSTALYANPTVLSYPYRVAGGCGLTEADALTKAVSEATERYISGLIRVDYTGPSLDAPLPTLDPDEVIHWYPAHPRINLLGTGSRYEWVAGTRMRTGDPCLVPIDFVFYPIDEKRLGRQVLYHANSNGVACHTDVTAAAQLALLELVERDAFLQLWYGRSTPARIPKGFLPSTVVKRIDYWNARGRDLWLLDITTDSAPVVLAAITGSDYPYLSLGAAAFFSQELHRGIAKAVQEAECLFLGLASSRAFVEHAEAVFSPRDHLAFYQSASRLSDLRWMFSGGSTAPVFAKDGRAEVDLDYLIDRFDPIMVELGADSALLHIGLSCVRTLSTRLLPLSFGYGLDPTNHPRLAGLGNDIRMPRLPHCFG